MIIVIIVAMKGMNCDTSLLVSRHYFATEIDPERSTVRCGSQ